MSRTVREFKADVMKALKEKYPTAAANWKRAPRYVKGVGYQGLAMVVDGLKTVFVLAEGDDTYTTVR